MKEGLNHLLKQAYQQYKLGDHIVKESYDIYVNSLIKQLPKCQRSEAISRWSELKNSDDDELKVNSNIQRDNEILRELGYKR